MWTINGDYQGTRLFRVPWALAFECWLRPLALGTARPGVNSSSTLIICVTLDNTYFLSELQKTEIIIAHYEHWIM